MSQPFVSMSNGSSSMGMGQMPRANGLGTGQGHSQMSSSPSGLARPPSRVDISRIKQELHDALGEDGLPYWKALNGYLLGQIGRGEVEGLVREWLKDGKVELHNKLLLSLLHNASIPTPSSSQSSPLNLKKRKRANPDDPDFDTDPTMIEPKSRVLNWAGGILTTKDRNRVKRTWTKSLQTEQEGGVEEPAWGQDRRKFGTQMQPGNTMPPLAASARLLPSSQQLAHRLSQLAKGYDLNIAPESMGDVGEFLAVGIDAHLSDILHAHVHLVGRDRPGEKTIHIPPGLSHSNVEQSETMLKGEVDDGEVPKPTLESMRNLLILTPNLHGNTSPALYRLGSGVMCAEAEYNAPPVKTEYAINGYRGREGVKERKSERVQRYLDNGMIKVDTTKEERKDKKHSLHWKYEDPALIFESVLG